jgi:hypothetical protein
MQKYRQFQLWPGLILVTLLPACAFHQSPVVLEPVGPAPVAASPASHAGGLLVYSDYDHFGDPRNIIHHSGYVVTSDDGKLVQKVPNRIDRFDEGPQHVDLPPGQYLVTARSAHYGKVNVPVIIKERQTTAVYLDGYPHPEAPSAGQTNTVQLPNGKVVGWSANSVATAPAVTGVH